MVKHFYEEIELPIPPNRPLIACNMVMSIDGKVTANGIQPANLGSSFDRKTMRVIRSHFDAVLTGSNTIRQFPLYLGVTPEFEQKRQSKGLAPQPLTIILTNSGKLPAEGPLFTSPPRPPVIITSPKGADNLAVQVSKVSKVEILDAPTPQAISTLLRDKYGVQRLLVEGGPSVNYQFMQAKLLDELFLTISPHLIGKRTDFSLAMGDFVLASSQLIKLVSVNQHSDELFLRYNINW